MNSWLIVKLLSNLSSLPCRKLHAVLAALTVPEDVGLGNKIHVSIWYIEKPRFTARGVTMSIPYPSPTSQGKVKEIERTNENTSV